MTLAGAMTRRAEGRTAGGFFARTFEVDCTVDLEQTNDSLHAYVFLDGYEVGPGDEVTVIDPPTAVPFGERLTCRRRARVRRAGFFARTWTPIAAYLELTDLYEVGFDPIDERSAS